MFKVGDFAKLAQISPHTLRYYDKIGIFSPEHVHAESGYRLYSVRQLTQLNRVLALRDLGFSIDEIRNTITHPNNDTDWLDLLAEKENQLQQHIATEQARLQRVRARLNLSKQTPLKQEVITKPLEAMPYFSTGHICEPDHTIAQIAEATYQTLAGQKLYADGIAYFVVWDAPTPENTHNIELGFRVSSTEIETLTTPHGTLLTLRELPAIPMVASVIYEGSRAEIQRGYEVLFRWMEANQVSIQGYLRERHLQPGSNALDPNSVIELMIPIEA